MYKCGFISLIGKPNVGKSTILNSLIGQKVSIVSNKPQTTRQNIIGVLNNEDYQMVFVDTPGIHDAKNKLDNYMNKNIKKALEGVDVLALVVDAKELVKKIDFNFISSFSNYGLPLILLINKIDLVTYEKLYPVIEKLSKLSYINDIIPLSGLQNKNIDVLERAILNYLPEIPKENAFYDKDDITDKSVKFLCEEIIREKTLELLNKEIPHGVAVVVTKFDEKDNIIFIDADIILEKESHKRIVIGKNGEVIKQIGTKARMDIEKLTSKKINLNTFVKIKKNWREEYRYLKDFGYSDKD